MTKTRVVVTSATTTCLALMVALFAHSNSQLEAPDRPYWAAVQPAFENAIANLPPEPATYKEHKYLLVPPEIGGVDIRAAWRMKGGVLFCEGKDPGFHDDTGIAYLPDGPPVELTTEKLATPHYKELSDGWYSWAATE